MITIILIISAAIWIISGLLFILVCNFGVLSDTSHDKTVITLGLICVVALINCVICKIAFCKDIDNEALAKVKEHYFELIEHCPLNVGECELKWLNYHADSLHCEYMVQRHKYE